MNPNTNTSMNRKLLPRLAALSLALLPSTLFAANDSSNTGSVYTMDNSASGNKVLAFQRGADGSLTPDGVFPTGGTGTSGGLGNQGAVMLSRDGQWLFVCNAGSDEISVFAVSAQGLQLTNKVSSEGRRPVSLALNGNLVYVLNAGGAVGDQDNITGYLFAKGKLSHLPSSTRPLSANSTGPGQVAFASDGGVLVVTEKATNIIDTFTVGDDGLANGHKTFTSPVPTPFGFATGRHDRIFVSEAGGGPNASSVSSYEVSDDGDVAAISQSVSTRQTAACWVVLTRNERFAYASNTGSGTISGYRVAPDGSLELLDADGITGNIGAGSAPIDMALSRNSRFLYTLTSGTGTLSAFGVNADGSLETLTGVSGIPAGANGLAAE